MQRTSILSLCCFLACALSVLAQVQPTNPAWYVPATARQGDPVFAWVDISPADGFLSTVTVRGPEGKTVSTAQSFHSPIPECSTLHGFAVGIPSDAAPGTYTLAFQGSLGGMPFAISKNLLVVARNFPVEKIRMTPVMAELRDKPDPRKEEESRRYVAALETFNPSATFLRDGFSIPTIDTRRTSGFGDRRNYVYANGSSKTGMHLGMDFSAPTGTPVTAPGDGRVVLVAKRILTGNTIILEHLPGVFTIYMHMNSLAVAEGTLVTRGQLIGTVGSTGFSTGPHLHWELRVATIPCDPEALVGDGPLDKVRRIITMSHATEGR